MPKTNGHSWRFKPRLRRHAFGWKSQPAITRLQEALTEIKLVSRIDPMIGAEGAVALLERISPALENVDSSSGAIGTAVNHTIAELVPVIVDAPADAGTRAAWLDRLFDAHAADQIPYIERLADYWGELCGTAQVASAFERDVPPLNSRRCPAPIPLNRTSRTQQTQKSFSTFCTAVPRRRALARNSSRRSSSFAPMTCWNAVLITGRLPAA